MVRVNTDHLERLQRRAARIIMRTSSGDEAIKYLRYDTLELRREKHVLRLVTRCLQGRVPQFLIGFSL